MTDEQKKAVTEWLGECRHLPGESIGECLFCDKIIIKGKNDNRTFTTPDDWFACWERLVEKNIVRKFLGYCEAEYMSNETIYDIYFPRSGFTNYLHSRTKDNTFLLCNLIAEAIEEGVL